MTERANMIRWSFALSVVGGALILAGGFAMATMSYVAPMAGFGVGGMMGMMGYYGGAAAAERMALWVMGWSLATGMAVVYAGMQTTRQPEAASFWGVLIIAMGALSFLGMGGFMLGGVASIAGGALAVAASSGDPRAGRSH
ncbi:MAG: hypothetical protein HY556_04065 [Euryarchaeota archaeon]|nr:hypothetical protein [Euryarchaeota archaeon]